MSGEAGASIQSEFYHIQYSSGISVSVAEPPQIEGVEPRDHTADFFESENKFYKNKLNEIRYQLDALFLKLISEKKLPLIPFDLNAHYSEAAIIEDTDQFITNQFAQKELEKRLAVNSTILSVAWDFTTGNFERIEISITTLSQIRRSQLMQIQSEILKFF